MHTRDITIIVIVITTTVTAQLISSVISDAG